MPYIFLDESGQFTKNDHEKYFVIGSFTVGNPRRTEKQFRAWQKTRFPKKMRNQNEIKFADIKIDNNLRLCKLRWLILRQMRIFKLQIGYPARLRDTWNKSRLEKSTMRF